MKQSIYDQVNGLVKVCQAQWQVQQALTEDTRAQLTDTAKALDAPEPTFTNKDELDAYLKNLLALAKQKEKVGPTL